MAFSVTCEKRFLRFLRYLLIIVNSSVTLIGCCIVVVAIWAKFHGDKFNDITDDHQSYTQLPIMALAVGIFVSVLGLVGIIGAMLANHVGGRLLLGLYGFVLGLIVMTEIASFITAILENHRLKEDIKTGMNETFLHYSNISTAKYTWDNFQKAFKCCGTYDYTSYEDLLDIDPPLSCCKTSKDCNPLSDNGEGLFEKGCVEKVENNISVILGSVAGMFGFAILFQVAGVVASCYVAIRGSIMKRKDYEFI